MPRHKGKIESGIKLRSGKCPPKAGASRACRAIFICRSGRSGVADTRIHGTTRQHVGRCCGSGTRPTVAMPAGLFPVFEEAPRTVHRDGYIEDCGGLITPCRRSMWGGRSGRDGSPACSGCSASAGKSSPSMCWPNRDSSHRPGPSAFPYRQVVQQSLEQLLDRARLIGPLKTGSWAGPWCNNAVPSAPASCTACWRWRKSIRLKPWKRPRRRRCITALSACATCALCSLKPPPRPNWTF